MPHNVTRILCIITGDMVSRRAEDWAVFLAKHMGAKIEFFHVVDDEFLDGLPTPIDMHREVDDELDHLTRTTTSKLKKKLRGTGVAYEIIVRHGSSEAEIVKECKDRKPDLIIMPYEPRGLLGFLLTKGIGHGRVIDDACCPVLVVKGEPDACSWDTTG